MAKNVEEMDGDDDNDEDPLDFSFMILMVVCT